ncbi:helix-turn-helix domain-containing protein [Saxibacter everestensis]|uniref:Helix-turn-helix domain-containing protein n=1 Tax=Saxibacter everestensis TaxID=2909229 RepID=A0ABY8QUG5_9MICO|nr:helix-turn-helix domain-containing protein [Brevibacteriaceae bacterium ZFBP1038]
MTIPKSADMRGRTVDSSSLKGLAHPLRIRILETLWSYGANTSCGLAERLGESSGSTSYHLRQLARHEFIRKVEGKGTKRECWWEVMPGGLTLATPDLATDPATRAASQLVSREFEDTRQQALSHFVVNGFELLPKHWVDASTITTAHFKLTSKQLAEISAEFEKFHDSVLAKYRGQDEPGARPVQVHINAFPLIDGEENPS